METSWKAPRHVAARVRVLHPRLRPEEGLSQAVQVRRQGEGPVHGSSWVGLGWECSGGSAPRTVRAPAMALSALSGDEQGILFVRMFRVPTRNAPPSPSRYLY